MNWTGNLILATVITCLAGCAANRPPPPDIDRHHCVTIPNGMVECTERPARPPAAN